MQAMQRAVIVIVGILSVVWATPFDLDSVNRPTPFRYKVEFGNDAFAEDSEHDEDYEIGTFESDQHSNFIDESDEGKSMQGIVDLFRDIKTCSLLNLETSVKDGCAYLANGDVYFFNVSSVIDIKDVYVAFGDAGIKECEVGEEGLKEEPKDGCFWINEDKDSVYWIGAYDDDVFYESDVADDIRDTFDNITKCDFTAEAVPASGCVMYDEDGIHLLNVLWRYVLNDDFKKAVGSLNIPECKFDEEHGLINNDPCYWLDGRLWSIHFLNLHGRSKGVQENDADDDSKEKFEIPDAEVSPLSVVETPTESGKLQQLKLKGLFNQRSSVAKKAKAVLPKKIQSRKQPQEVQHKLGRRGQQHGRHGSNGGRVNHRLNWMKYIQTNN